MTAPRRDLHDPRMPGLFAQLSVLPPAVQVAAATLMLAMGIAGIWLMPTGFASWLLLIVAFAVGGPVGVQGLTLQRERRVEAEEMRRAKDELPELRLVVDDAQGELRGVERTLMKRGYTSAKVRRWIAPECGVVLPRRDA
ncbi:MAG: hypothetical protein KAI24_26490 [Planctomycetes bacterium]|nr:hypothetical protein [Planctomycetota bacterium]